MHSFASHDYFQPSLSFLLVIQIGKRSLAIQRDHREVLTAVQQLQQQADRIEARLGPPGLEALEVQGDAMSRLKTFDSLVQSISQTLLPR